MYVHSMFVLPLYDFCSWSLWLFSHWILGILEICMLSNPKVFRKTIFDNQKNASSIVSLHVFIFNRNITNEYSLLFCQTKEMTFLVRLSRVDRSAYRFWLFGVKNFEPWVLVGFDNILFVGRRVRRWYASVFGCLRWVLALKPWSKLT